MTIGEVLLLKIIEERRALDFARLHNTSFIGDEVRLYKYIANHYQSYGTLPTLDTLKQAYGIDELEYQTYQEPYAYYYQEFQSRAVFTCVNEAIPKINTLLSNREGIQIYNEITHLYNKLNERMSQLCRDILPLSSVFEVTLETLRERRRTHGVTGIPTGWETLDNITHGMQRGDIFLVLARVKVGKTACLLYMASHAQRAGYKVMFISMEMTKEQIGERLLALNAGLNINYIRSGELTTTSEELILEEIERQKTQLPPFYYVEGQLKKNITELTALIDAYRPDIVFIDGAYLIKPSNFHPSQRSWERVSEVIDTLKSSAIQYNIPIVPSYQFNRQVKRGAISVSDDAFEKIQLSDAISQLASSGIAILNDPDSRDDVKLIELIGGRYGEAGSFRIRWDWERMDFSEIREDVIIDTENEEDHIIW